jgi:hypothetical protein
MTLLLPNSELVALGWLALVPGFTTAMLGMTLPRIPGSGTLPAWIASGFVQVPFVVGGSPDPYSTQARPVVQVSCWAANAKQDVPGGPIATSNKPPWGKANQLAEQIRAAAQSLMFSGTPRNVAMPMPGYAHANVQSAWLLTEPRRIPSDMAGYAHFSFDLQLTWIAEAT